MDQCWPTKISDNPGGLERYQRYISVSVICAATSLSLPTSSHLSRCSAIAGSVISSSNLFSAMIWHVSNSATTAQAIVNEVMFAYGSGPLEGLEVEDSLKFSPNVAIQSQSIGAALYISLKLSKMFWFDSALQSQGFDGVDGILGIGPVDLTVGGTDSSKYTDDYSLNTGRYRRHCTSLYVSAFNTGTTLILIASDPFSRYMSAAGAVRQDHWSPSHHLVSFASPPSFSAARSAIHSSRSPK
ncbi:uncharacterized protein LACBIDRAFT_332907 [Laccaria bicolor S238N-H82]|uniref:Predicted protein n=1 Tax=Laccaria bicolor (strain S238N-H82 / ATCC MYA-4686) TaxID=486041 RepID=B0DU84_LACBS|nr:uncharacterized protein LACBIDRAFT_332907 [Laccaria bicolor S238N-H82]EDR01858.1 predicted protein [Laccaria bicolor S238N-H82]|eukprot:XP_001887468.1 predicted protein [Laccaria bicolor S238N-H82]